MKRLRVSERQRRLAQLSAWLVAIGVVWLLVLPSLSRRESNRVYLERLKQRGIDPSAMYYTELPPELFLDS